MLRKTTEEYVPYTNPFQTFDAKRAWREFHTKYSTISRTNYDVQKEKKLYPVTPAMAKVALKYWRQVTTSHKTVAVRVGANRKLNRFHYFFNNQTSLRKSLNKSKLKLLSSAIRLGVLNADIMSDPLIFELAVTLFQNQSITSQQFYSLIEMIQIREDFPITCFHPVLDDCKLSFSPQAKKILAEQISLLNKNQIQKFLSLLKELPESELYVYECSMSQINHRDPKTSFLHYLIDKQVIFENKEAGTLINTTHGIRDAFGLARYADQYKPAFPILGKLSTHDIEHGVRLFFRPQACTAPTTYSYKNVPLHGYREITLLEALKHDEGHAGLLSLAHNSFLKALHRSVDVVRRDLHVTQSKETWTSIDAGFTNYYVPSTCGNDASVVTREFCEYLFAGTTEGEQGGYFYQIAEDDKTVITVVGWVVVLDMLQNPVAWKELLINPDDLSGRLGFIYNNLYYIMQLIPQNLPLEIKLFLFIQIDLMLGNNLVDEVLPFVNQVMKQQNEIAASLFIKKRKPEDLQNRPALDLNTISLCCTKHPLLERTDDAPEEPSDKQKDALNSLYVLRKHDYSGYGVSEARANIDKELQKMKQPVTNLENGASLRRSF